MNPWQSHFMNPFQSQLAYNFSQHGHPLQAGYANPFYLNALNYNAGLYGRHDMFNPHSLHLSAFNPSANRRSTDQEVHATQMPVQTHQAGQQSSCTALVPTPRKDMAYRERSPTVTTPPPSITIDKISKASLMKLFRPHPLAPLSGILTHSDTSHFF